MGLREQILDTAGYSVVTPMDSTEALLALRSLRGKCHPKFRLCRLEEV